MAELEIWVNPDCSKCRTATAELDAAGIAYVVRRYLEEPPTTAELAGVLDRMQLQPWDIARAKEAREAGIDLPRDEAHREDWIVAMAAAPLTIQRPIITASDGSTVIARDNDTLETVISGESS